MSPLKAALHPVAASGIAFRVDAKTRGCGDSLKHPGQPERCRGRTGQVLRRSTEH